MGGGAAETGAAKPRATCRLHRYDDPEGSPGASSVTDEALLVITFTAPSTLLRERHRSSDLPIVGNGPPGTFVVFPHGLRVSLPTDQIVAEEDDDGRARVTFGGMRYVSAEEDRLVFVREREVLPDEQLSPARSRVMHLEKAWVALAIDDGRQVWPLVE